MSGVLKIKNITVYTVMNEHAKECWDVLKLLQDNGIPFNHLHYHSTDDMNSTITSLKTWTFSTDHENRFQRDFTKFPIIHWETVNENFDKFMNVAEGFEEFQNSQLMLEKDKILNRIV